MDEKQNMERDLQDVGGNKVQDEEKSMELIGAEALDHARKAFEDYINEEHCIDPAYFDIRFTAWVKDCDFRERLARIEIEREVK